MGLLDIPLRETTDDLCNAVLTAATEVHREFGPGLLESFYQKALSMMLTSYGIVHQTEVDIQPTWRGVRMPIAYRADMIIQDCLLLELKAVEAFHKVHMAQTISYLKLLRLKRGYLLNFNVPLFKEGIRRVSI